MSSLMNISYDIIQCVNVSLAFDDGTVKKYTIAPGDIVTVTYNYNGERRTETGKVTKIVSDSVNSCCCDANKWIMVIDASAYGGATLTRITINKILDLSIVRKAADFSDITSPTGEYNISNLRLVGNVLQLSVDDGVTWLNVSTLQAVDPGIADDDAKYVEKVKQILPANLRPDVYATMLKSMVALLKQADQEAKTNS